MRSYPELPERVSLANRSIIMKMADLEKVSGGGEGPVIRAPDTNVGIDHTGTSIDKDPQYRPYTMEFMFDGINVSYSFI